MTYEERVLIGAYAGQLKSCLEVVLDEVAPWETRRKLLQECRDNAIFLRDSMAALEVPF
jgi:hypothetical protein